LLISGCVTKTWRDRALQDRPDRETPELAFETFRAAIRLDDALLGYKLISEAMKERDKIDSTVFALGWDAFFKRYPAARLLGNAEIVKAERLDPLRARVDASAYGYTIRLDFVRQDFYDVRWRTLEGETRRVDGYIPGVESRVFRAKDAPESLVAFAANAELASVDPKSIVLFTIGTEWKILGIAELDNGVPKPLTSMSR
jgi:hypothetical protein